MSRKVIFKITDPEGRSVTFYDDTWKHIRSGHPEIKTYRRVKTTVMDPHFILRNPLRKSLIYIDCGQLNLYFNVVTKIDDALNECTVSTAYLSSNIQEGDVIWRKTQ